MATVAWSQNVARQFKPYIEGFLLAPATLYNFFKANGIKTAIGKGVDRFTYLEAKEPEGGMLTDSIHNYNTVAPYWAEQTTGLDYLVARVVLSRGDVDKYKNGNWLRGDLIADTMNMLMPKMINQMDQLLAWGDEYQDTVDLEVFAASGEITGIFNGGTAYGAGLDGDDDMQTAQDYIDTVNGMINALKTAHHHLDQYLILSDLTTERYSKNENQFYSTVGITEHQRILEMKAVKDWIASENFIDNSAVKYRMAMLAPTQKQGAIAGKGPQGNFELFMGYDFDVHFDANGGTIDNYFIFYMTCSFKLVEYRSTAIQRSGTLTLT